MVKNSFNFFKCDSMFYLSFVVLFYLDGICEGVRCKFRCDWVCFGRSLVV